MSNTNTPESQANTMMAVLVVIAIAVVLVLVGTANPADSLPPQTADSVAQASEALADAQAGDEEVAAVEDTQDSTDAAVDETADAETVDATGEEATTEETTTDAATTEDTASAEETTTDSATTEETTAVIVAFDAGKAFAISCSACHGLDGQGVADDSGMMMGGLAGSALVSDAGALADFISNGSGEMVDPATGMPHPIFGHGFYTAEQIDELASYIGSLVGDAPADGGDASSSDAGDTEAAPVEETAFDAAAAYGLSCAGCHASDGSGVMGLAQPLSPDSELIADADAYLDFLVTGMMEIQAMGMVHPPRGGAANYNDDELKAIMDYTMTLFE